MNRWRAKGSVLLGQLHHHTSLYRCYHQSLFLLKKKEGFLVNESDRRGNVLTSREGENPQEEGYRFSDEFLKSIRNTYKNADNEDISHDEVMEKYGYKKMSESMPERGKAYSHKELNQFHDILNRGITITMDETSRSVLKDEQLDTASQIERDMSEVRVFMPKSRGVGEVSTVDELLIERGQSIKMLSESRFESRADLEAYLKNEKDISPSERDELENLLNMEADLRKQLEKDGSRYSIVTDQSYDTNWWKVLFYLCISSYISLYILINVSDSNRLVIYEPLRDYVLSSLGFTPPEKSKGMMKPKQKTKFVKKDENTYVKTKEEQE